MGKHSKEPEKKTKTAKNKEVPKKQKNKAEKGKVQKAKVNNKRTTKPKKKSRKLMKTVLTLLVLGVITLGVLAGYRVQTLGGGVTGVLATLLGEDEASLENIEPINIVVMGVSGVDDYKLADTIMVVSYNPKTQKASLMSIPRDTYVGKKDRHTATTNYIASYKINTVFRNLTNIPEAMDRISTLTGMNLENYIIIDTKALIKLVDAIGGVTFNVPIDMDYDDESQDLYIHLKAGEQLIDGPKAEQLLRFRHNNNGSTYPSDYGTEDLGRMRTQREFVTETIKQTMKPKNIFKIRNVIDIMNQDITTNMDIDSLKSYLPFAVKFDASELKTDVLPGTPEMCNGVSIMVANTREAKTMVQNLFGEEGTDSLSDSDE